MKIFMGHHRLYTLECLIGLREWVGKHTGGIEDIETFILHRTHIEVVNGNNHKDIQIIFTTIDLLVPSHSALQRVHRIVNFVQIFLLDENLKSNLSPT